MTDLGKLILTLSVIIYSIFFIIFLPGFDSDKNAEKKFQQHVDTVKDLGRSYSRTRHIVQEVARDYLFINQGYLPWELPRGVTDHEISQEGIIRVYHEDVHISMVPKYNGETLEIDRKYGDLQWTFHCKPPEDVVYRPCIGY